MDIVEVLLLIFFVLMGFVVLKILFLVFRDPKDPGEG